MARRARQSLRPGRAAPEGAFAKLRVRTSAVLGPPAPSPRPPGTSSWPRPPPHWWQPSSSETASEAAYASFAAAARRMSPGRLRPRSLQCFTQHTAGAGQAAPTNKPRGSAPRPSLHRRGGRASQCRPAGTCSPAPWRPGWGACRPGQQKQAGRPGAQRGARSRCENRLAGWIPGWKMQLVSRDSGKGDLPSAFPGMGRPFTYRQSAVFPSPALETPEGIQFSLICTNY